MLDNLRNYNIILGSKSPRRKEILSMLRLPFQVITLENIDETYPESVPLEDVPVYIGNKKADAFLKYLEGENNLIITADTLVICENKLLGKPANIDDAKEMLSFLSGKTHKVVTGVVIATHRLRNSFNSHSLVSFAQLSTDEIDYYVDNFRPMDKAGAYGIQEWIGAVAVKSIEGSFYNVMGLPVHALYQELKKIPTI